MVGDVIDRGDGSGSVTGRGDLIDRRLVGMAWICPGMTAVFMCWVAGAIELVMVLLLVIRVPWST